MTNWRILRNRFRKILVATVILTAIGIPLLMTIGAQPARAATGLLLFGLGLGAFEEFYFQAKSGEWLRRLHPLVSLAISIAAALAIVAAATVVIERGDDELDRRVNDLTVHMTLHLHRPALPAFCKLGRAPPARGEPRSTEA